jgi:ATP-dependent Clp protease ATP-binding subunit ClpC
VQRLTREAGQALDLARDEARRLRHRKVRTEHLLLGILRCERGLGAEVLRARGVSLEEARGAVERIAGRGEDELWAALIPFSGRSRRALERAAAEAGSLADDRVGTEHVLLSLLRDDDGAGAQVLSAFGIDYERARDGVVAARVSPHRRPRAWHRRRDMQLALGVAAVFAAGVLVGRVLRGH